MSVGSPHGINHGLFGVGAESLPFSSGQFPWGVGVYLVKATVAVLVVADVYLKLYTIANLVKDCSPWIQNVSCWRRSLCNCNSSVANDVFAGKHLQWASRSLCSCLFEIGSICNSCLFEIGSICNSCLCEIGSSCCRSLCSCLCEIGSSCCRSLCSCLFEICSTFFEQLLIYPDF